MRTFAEAHGLTVLQEHAARRTVILSGTVAQFSAAFGVQLHQMSYAGGTYRGRTGGIYLPTEWDGVVEAILGLDNRPQARPHFRSRAGAGQHPPPRPRSRGVLHAAAGGRALRLPERAPAPASASALIELGGGYRPADLSTYFGGLDVPAPTVTAVSVDHATNSPTGDARGPGRRSHARHRGGRVDRAAARGSPSISRPNTDAGFLDAITTAIHDTTNNPSVLSISWGGAESTWTSQAMTAMDEAFQAAATMGITVCVASGDSGSSDGVSDGADHVDFPASSPHVLACGGTSLTAQRSSIASETVWNDGASGGRDRRRHQQLLSRCRRGRRA